MWRARFFRLSAGKGSFVRHSARALPRPTAWAI
jgi:hypothetical protein